jgi:hypothetical protein
VRRRRHHSDHKEPHRGLGAPPALAMSRMSSCTDKRPLSVKERCLPSRYDSGVRDAYASRWDARQEIMPIPTSFTTVIGQELPCHRNTSTMVVTRSRAGQLQEHPPPAADPQPPVTSNVLLCGGERGVSCRSRQSSDDRRCHHRVHIGVGEACSRARHDSPPALPWQPMASRILVSAVGRHFSVPSTCES